MEERLGRYELRGAVGRGAAGTVYEAWDTALARRVAIKVVRLADKDALEVDDLLARFRQEAQVASRLSHPGVISVYDYGENDGIAYIVMEFVAGETLSTVLNRGERLPLTRVVAILSAVLLALDYCHRNAIVHRDIKPSNIMLPAEGGVKLADFGIARIENSDLTVIGTVMGTPPYMSPEQFAAEEDVDFRTDLWSVGVVLYEMLTGTRPFSGSNMGALRQSVKSQAAEPPSRRSPGVPEIVDQVILRALRKAPADRFPSAAAFASALDAALPAAARRSVPVAPSRKSRVPLFAGGIGAATALIAGAAFLLWPQAQPVQPEQPLSARLAALPCSTVTTLSEGTGPQGTILRGVVGAGAPRDALDAIVGHLPTGTVRADVQTFPSSALSCQLAELVRANPATGEMRLATSDGRSNLVDHDEIRLRLRMPDFGGEVRLEDLNADGSITHLMEANHGSPQRRLANAQIGLGPAGADLIGHVSAPFGADVLVALVSSDPLFPAPRPAEENGDRYLADLTTAIDTLRRRGGRIAMDALVLTTSQH